MRLKLEGPLLQVSKVWCLVRTLDSVALQPFYITNRPSYSLRLCEYLSLRIVPPMALFAFAHYACRRVRLTPFLPPLARHDVSERLLYLFSTSMREIVHLQTGQVSGGPSHPTFELMMLISPNLTVRQPNWYDKPSFLVLTVVA